jgi:hypothetical protein
MVSFRAIAYQERVSCPFGRLGARTEFAPAIQVLRVCARRLKVLLGFFPFLLC